MSKKCCYSGLIAGLFLWCSSFASLVYGAGGKLPRGTSVPKEIQSPAAAAATKVKGNTAAKPRVTSGAKKIASHCRDDLSLVNGAPGFFSADGTQYYHFSPMEKAKHKGGRRPWFRYNVHRVDFVTGKVSVVVAIELPQVDAAVGHGLPIRGATAVVWKPAAVECKSGEANYVTVAFDSSFPARGRRNVAPKAVQAHGQVSIVNSQKQKFIFNNKKRSILELDFSLFQTRTTSIRTPAGERPLYIDLSKRIQYTWHSKGADRVKRGLVAYKNLSKPVARLAYKSGDKLLQNKKLFGVAHFDLRNNSIKIKEIARWSGGKKSSDYVILLPKKIDIKGADLQPHFSSNRVVLSASSLGAKKRWRTALIYDYAKGIEVGKMKLGSSEFVGNIKMTPDASKVIAFIFDYRTETLKRVMLFSFSTSKWVSVPIPAIR